MDKSKKSILRIIMISKEYFEKVQKFKKMRSRCIFDEKGNKVIRHNQYRSKSIYSNVLVCGYCDVQQEWIKEEVNALIQ